MRPGFREFTLDQTAGMFSQGGLPPWGEVDACNDLIAAMANFVLVHGSFHGPWCWEKIALALRAAGHWVATPDLAAAAHAGAYPDLHAYAAHVANAVAMADGEVILVGHSMGGLVISQAAERISASLSALVYVTGLLLRDGETLQRFLAAHEDLGVDDLVLQNMVVSTDGTLARFPEAAAPGIFYNSCSAADAKWAAAQLRPQPTAVYATPLRITGRKFGSVPRCYVMCEDDRAVSPAYQRQMLANTECGKIYRLDADHSPFLSAQAALLDCLQDIAGARA